MSRHHNKQCNEKKHCEKECTRYDSWCEESDECGKVTGKVKTIVIKKFDFCQDKKICQKWGHVERCEGEWECIETCNEKPKLVKNHHEKNHHDKNHKKY